MTCAQAAALADNSGYLALLARAEKAEARVKALEALWKKMARLLIDVDSELSAIAHGRPPSPDMELLEMSMRARDLYNAGRGEEVPQ